MRVFAATITLIASLCCFAQKPVANQPLQVTVPHLIRISGQMADANSTVGVTFSLYKSQTDTAPLWTETQNIRPDASGKYTALIGATKAEGIPLELFASGEAQWLGIRQEGKSEQPRVLLVSVPYAMKAAEAETLEGHTAAEFVTQQNLAAAIELKLQEPEIRTVLASPFSSETSPASAGATNFTDTTSNQIIAVTQNGTGRLITGEGPSHTQVFAVDQSGEIHGTGLSLDGSAGRSISMGNNATSGGTGYQLLVRAGTPASGSTNKRGGELQLAAGPGTGTGGSGDVVIQAAAPVASGTTTDSLVTRHLYASSPVSMGGATGSAELADVVEPDGESAAIEIHFKIQASDGDKNSGAAGGECMFVETLSPDGGGTAAYSHLGSDYTESSSTPMNAACTIFYGGISGSWIIGVSDSLAYTPTIHTIIYEIHNISEWPMTLYANTSGAEKLPLSMVAARASREHPMVSVRRDADGKITVSGEANKP